MKLTDRQMNLTVTFYECTFGCTLQIVHRNSVCEYEFISENNSLEIPTLWYVNQL